MWSAESGLEKGKNCGDRFDSAGGVSGVHMRRKRERKTRRGESRGKDAVGLIQPASMVLWGSPWLKLCVDEAFHGAGYPCHGAATDACC